MKVLLPTGRDVIIWSVTQLCSVKVCQTDAGLTSGPGAAFNLPPDGMLLRVECQHPQTSKSGVADLKLGYLIHDCYPMIWQCNCCSPRLLLALPMPQEGLRLRPSMPGRNFSLYAGVGTAPIHPSPKAPWVGDSLVG